MVDLSLQERMPEIYEEMVDVFGRLEAHFGDMQDVEFTVQDGKLFILQTRSGKRTTRAAIKIAVDMVSAGRLMMAKPCCALTRLRLNNYCTRH